MNCSLWKGKVVVGDWDKKSASLRKSKWVGKGNLVARVCHPAIWELAAKGSKVQNSQATVAYAFNGAKETEACGSLSLKPTFKLYTKSKTACLKKQTTDKKFKNNTTQSTETLPQNKTFVKGLGI